MLERVSLIQPNQIKAPDSSRVITYLNLDWNQPIKGSKAQFLCTKAIKA